MRARLIALLVLLMGCVLAALSVPFAQSLAARQQQAMYVDRLQDTIRFASAAQQVDGNIDEQALRDDLSRYASVYGVSAAWLDRTGTPRAFGGRAADLDTAPVRDGVRYALAGHQTANPPTIWPWHDSPLVIVVPVIRADDVIGVAVTVSPTDRLRRAVGFDLEKLAVAEVAALIALVALASRLASWVLKPVYVLDDAAHRISSGDLSTRVSATQGPVELRRLATSFNGMASAVEDAMDRQSAFVADASHQLRNPLAALMLRLEALAIEVDSTELALVREEAARLSVILDELLELATAQHVQAEPLVVDLVDLVTARLDAWQPIARRAGVRLRYPAPGELLTLVDPALAGSALDAVLDNAVKFSPSGGRVDVDVVADGPDPRVDVTDQGPGLCTDELERIGDRFWRSPASQNVPGSGLGLSIARTLLTATGGRLGFAAPPAGGLRVSLWLPPAPVASPVTPPVPAGAP